MSRLESDQEFEFVIQNETSDERAGSAFPLTHRQNAIQQFDNESLDQGKTRTVTVPVSADLVKILDSAQTLYEAEDYQPAHSLYEAALKRDHQNEEALTGLAQCAVKMGNNGEALIAIQKLTKLHPNFSNFVWLADELYLSDRIDEAYENYMRAQLEPHIEGEVLFSVFKNLGNIALRKSDLESAEEF